ncbi:MAG: glycosyltransferase family 39 protein [Nanoarchaeota archaeon]|nr:glycosyltransferase family 39 protein [Nanoarchaeota archaeon]
MKLKKSYIVFLIFAIILLFQYINFIPKNSMSPDESCHIGAGYSHWKGKDFGQTTLYETPEFARMWGTIPLLFFDIPPALYLEPRIQNLDDPYIIGKLMLFKYIPNVERAVYLMKFSYFFLYLLLAFVLYKWSKALFGKYPAYLALFLLAFEPNILGHSMQVASDFSVTVFVFVSFYLLWRLKQTPNLLNLCLLGIAAGIMLISKLSSLIIFFTIIIFLLAIFYMHGKKIVEKVKTSNKLVPLVLCFIIFFAAVAVSINCIYLFDSTFVQPKDIEFKGKQMQILHAPVLKHIPIPLPKKLLYSVDFSLSQGGMIAYATYINGELYTDGSIWYYYFYSFFLKTPITLLIFFLLGMFFLFYDKRLTKKISFYDKLFLLAPLLVIFLVFSFYVQLIMGMRYILPAFPFVILIASQVANVKFTKIIKYVFFALCLFYVFSILAASFNYIGYFNEFVGGPSNGYKYLSNADADWGQDLYRFQDYMQEKGITGIGLSYFGNDMIALSKINHYTPPCYNATGRFAVSHLHTLGFIYTGQPKDCYTWLQDYEPVEVVGSSILIYDIPKNR